MFQFRTFYAAPVEHPVILLSKETDSTDKTRKPLHSGCAALEGLVISLGGDVHLEDAPLITNFKEKIRIIELGMTDGGLLAVEENHPDKTFLLWGTSAEDFDKLQEHILAANPDIPDSIIERDYLRALNKSFICEHGELDESDLRKISQTRSVLNIARARVAGKEIPLPGDIVEGAYYNGKHPFHYGIIDSRDYMTEEGRLTICAGGSPYIVPSTASLSISGGPFFSVEPRHLTYIGKEERLFWTFGHDGACANGGVYFPVTVNCWTLLPEAGI